MFKHDLFPNEELHCVTKFYKGTVEGSKVDLFQSDKCVDSSGVVSRTATAHVEDEVEAEGPEEQEGRGQAP